MLSYKQWKVLNESFAGPLTLGLSRPSDLGIVSDRPLFFNPNQVFEGRKKSKKYMDDNDDGNVKITIDGDDADEDDIEDSIDDGPCGKAKCGKAKCGKAKSKKKSKKKSRKYMGSDTGDIAGVPGGGMGRLKPKSKHVHVGHDLGEEDPDGEDVDASEEEPLDDGDDLDLGDEDDMGDDLGGDDMDSDGDMDGDDGESDLDGDGDMDLGDDDGSMPMKKKPGKTMFMRKKMRKKMRKEHTTPEEREWWMSVRSMIGSTDPKYNDGWSEYQEEMLIAPDDPNVGLANEPGPGEVGFAPATRFGLQGQGQYEESRRRSRRSR